MTQRRAGLLLAAALLAGTAACGGSTGSGASGGPPVRLVDGGDQGPWRGDELAAPIPKPDLRMTDTAGQRYDLRQRTAGKVVLLFFGYTSCPDVCPTTMADVAAALRRIPETDRRQIATVFVTVDPARDTGPVIRRWLDHFDPSFVGLRAPIGQVIAAQRAVHVPVSARDPGSTRGYAVTHSAELLAFSRDDQAHVVYLASGMSVDDLADDLPRLVAGPA